MAMDSIFVFDVSHKLGKEYVRVCDDVLRFVSIQFVVQVLLFTVNSEAFPIFSIDFLLLLSFVVLGVMFYWLIVTRLVKFQ